MNNRPVAVQLVSTGGFYGAERALLELATYLRDSGWDSRVIALEGKGAGELVRRAAAEGISAQALATDSRLSFWRMMRGIRAALQDCHRAVLHSHGYKPDLLLAAVGAPARFGCVATCHTWYSETIKMRLVEWADKRALRRFDHVVAVSEGIRAELRASGLPDRMLSQIDNGICVPMPNSSTSLAVRDELGIGPSDRFIVQIGRLARSKRNDLLIEAAFRLKDRIPLKVAFAGDGEMRAELGALVGKLGLEKHIRFLGYRENAGDLLAAADAMVLTSDKEGLPIIILEAMAIGCPIVATSVGEIPSVLTNRENALVVPPGNVDALVGAIDDALRNVACSRRRAEIARTEFTSSFSRDCMGRRYLDIYRRIWDAGAGASLVDHASN